MQSIYDIAEICARKGIDTVVLSPGSRSAPLVLAFSRHASIQKYVVLDERCAAYMALGMAHTSGKTVALVCTSGTAALNFAPAVAEAFYLNIPLLVLTADRPPEWVDQADGQTIRQQNLYGLHAKRSFQLPADVASPEAIWHINRTLNEAINTAQAPQKGPVHVNVPLREPLYPAQDTPITYSGPRIMQRMEVEPGLSPGDWAQLKEEFNRSDKKLLVLGQQAYSAEFVKQLHAFVESTGTVLVADVLGNAHFMLGEFVRHQDLFLGHLSSEQLEDLRPNLLITMGNSLISKNLKLFLRKQKPDGHWHIAEGDTCPDTFRSLSRHIAVPGLSFLKMANQTASGLENERKDSYSTRWLETDKAVGGLLEEYQKTIVHSDFAATYQLLQALPEQSLLHVGNSMSIRYVNYIGLHKKVEVYGNRGTSGIDGCVSTAIGAAHKTSRTVTLLIGDLSFFYDSNALFQERLPMNLKIVVLNNRSGNIFRMIDGPSHLPEGEPYFETPHSRSVKFLVEGFGLAYLHADAKTQLSQAFEKLFTSSGPTVLEIHTDPSKNKEALKELMVRWRAKP